jgi:hypothetical protein
VQVGVELKRFEKRSFSSLPRAQLPVEIEVAKAHIRQRRIRPQSDALFETVPSFCDRSFRHKDLPEHRATQVGMPVEANCLMEVFKSAIEIIGIPCVPSELCHRNRVERIAPELLLQFVDALSGN